MALLKFIADMTETDGVTLIGWLSRLPKPACSVSFCLGALNIGVSSSHLYGEGKKRDEKTVSTSKNLVINMTETEENDGSFMQWRRIRGEGERSKIPLTKIMRRESNVLSPTRSGV